MSDDTGPSRDIALKPAESGWGFSEKYYNNFVSIIGIQSAEKEKRVAVLI